MCVCPWGIFQVAFLQVAFLHTLRFRSRQVAFSVFKCTFRETKKGWHAFVPPAFLEKSGVETYVFCDEVGKVCDFGVLGANVGKKKSQFQISSFFF